MDGVHVYYSGHFVGEKIFNNVHSFYIEVIKYH